MTETVDTSRELAAFLRNRRESLDPDDFAVVSRRRPRRTPGLRREEVAELAGVSIDYVVRLEQARGPRPSTEVVAALAEALRLSPGERAYLYGLAGRRPRDAGEPVAEAAPPLRRLVADLSPLPTLLLNHRYDILDWNPAMARLLLDFDTLPPQQRNVMWLCLRHPGLRERYLDLDLVVREGVAHLRAAWAAHPEDRALKRLIAEFRAADPDFARLWAQRDVRGAGRGTKALNHPEVGRLNLEFEVLAPVENPEQRLLIYRAADAAGREALARLTGS